LNAEKYEQMEMQTTAAAKLSGYILKWPIQKETRSFRAYVVEPTKYAPQTHAAIFNATLTALTSAEPDLLDQYQVPRNLPVKERFDLVTFPEAFLPAEELRAALHQISGFDNFGCVHVGLRPSVDEATHLFTIAEFEALIDVLSVISKLHCNDLTPVKTWLAGQPKHLRFNVGCLFAVDANGEIRVCLHPKMVRSKFEISATQEKSMAEANLIALITLLPDNKQYLSVTLQPLLCSDALQLDTDIPGQLPLDCVNKDGNSFSGFPPDHIDIVSVATCTPQPEGTHGDGGKYRQWHPDFRATFQRVGNGGALTRHYHCTFVLSNFHDLPAGSYSTPAETYGGLSGAFIPVAFRNEDPAPFMQISSFGREKAASGADNAWSIPSKRAYPTRSTLGYIAQLDPYDENLPDAKLLGFTITRFPRDDSRWKPQAALARFEVQIALFDNAQKTIKFEGIRK
jgi:hypothetical protein